MTFDDHLRDSLTDDRWALPVAPDTLDRVRRARDRRRRVRTGAAVLATAGVVGAGAVLLGQAPAGQGRQVVLPGSEASPTLDPAVSLVASCATAPAGRLPGSDYTVRSARDWFVTREQSDAFFRTYSAPSPGPDAVAPSPQPGGPQSDHLVSALTAGGVPGAEGLRRDEAQSGTRNSPQLEGTLPDGRPLLVSRTRLQVPASTSGYYASDTEDSSKDVTVEPVPGTDCVALLLAPTTHRTALVQVVTPDGLSTGWSSEQVPLATLKEWAFAAAQWETAHPNG